MTLQQIFIALARDAWEFDIASRTLVMFRFQSCWLNCSFGFFLSFSLNFYLLFRQAFSKLSCWAWKHYLSYFKTMEISPRTAKESSAFSSTLLIISSWIGMFCFMKLSLSWQYLKSSSMVSWIFYPWTLFIICDTRLQCQEVYKYSIKVWRRIQYQYIRQSTEMRKTFGDHAYSSIKQVQLLNRIFHNLNPLQQLDLELNRTESLLLEVSDEERLNRVRDYVQHVLEQGVGQLQRKIRFGESADQVQELLIKILSIQRRLIKNQFYKKQVSGLWGPLYLRVLVWSSKMALSEEVLRIISELSFDKSLKLYYYYFKYYMSHLNLFYPDQIQIKHLFIASPTLNFGFIRHPSPLDQIRSQGSSQTDNLIISIPDLPRYFQENGLAEANHYTGACLINSKFNLGLTEEDQIFHALMVKLKLLMNVDKNSAVRTVIYANLVFGLFESEFLRAGQRVIGMPDIFELPPHYARILEDLIELFFEPTATPETHLSILTFIDSMLALENKRDYRQFFHSLNENTSALLGLIESLIAAISPEQSHFQMELQGTVGTKKIPVDSVRSKEVVQKFVYLICKQIVEATEIHSLAEELATLIFTKKATIAVTEKTIEHCGEILIIVETDQQELLNFAITQIRNQKEQAHSYLKVLNMFFTTKHLRQRRDLTLIARAITESDLFAMLLPIIQKECQPIESEPLLFSSKSFTFTAINLIGSICSENPSLVDSIAKHEVMDLVLEYLTKIDRVDDYQCIQVINFIHYICLKQGEVRNKVLTRHLQTLIRRFLLSNLYEHLHTKNYGILLTALGKLMSNIPTTSLCIFFGISQALKDLSSDYKQLGSIQKIIQPDTRVNEEHYRLVEQYSILDTKLIIITKLIEKCKEHIFPRSKVQWLCIMYRRLIKLCFVRTYSLIDFPVEIRTIINHIHDLRVMCERKIKRKTEMSRMSDREREGQAIQDGVQMGMENAGGNEKLEKEIEEQFQREELEMKNLSSNQEIINQIGLLPMPEEQGARKESVSMEEPKKSEIKQNENEKQILKEKEEGKEKQANNIEEEVIIIVETERNFKQMSFLNLELKGICKSLKQCLEHPSYVPSRTPRKVAEILFTEPYISTELYLELKISICMAKIDRLLYYISKELMQSSCCNPTYNDMFLGIQSLLPHFTQMLSLASSQFLTRNLPTLTHPTLPQKYTKRSQPQSRLSYKKISTELSLKPKNKIVNYNMFLAIVVRSIGTSAERQGQRYVRRFIGEVVVKFDGYVEGVLEEMRGRGGKGVTLLDVERMKDIVERYTELFCIARKRHRQSEIDIPYNNIFLHYILHTRNSEYPTFLQLLTQFLILTAEDPTLHGEKNLPDTPENRILMMRRAQIEIMIDLVAELFNRVFEFGGQGFQGDGMTDRLRTELEGIINLGDIRHGHEQEQEQQREEKEGDEQGDRDRAEREKIIKQLGHQIVLFSIHRAYEIYSKIRKQLSFHQPHNPESLDKKPRATLTNKFTLFLTTNPQIRQILTNNPLTFTAETLTNPNFALSEDDFNSKMHDLVLDLFEWMVSNNGGRLGKKDLAFVLRASEQISIEEVEDITDKAMRIRVVGRRKFQEFCQDAILVSKRLFAGYKIQWHFSRFLTKQINKSVEKKLAEQRKTGSSPSIKQNVLKLANIVNFFTRQIESQSEQLIKQFIDQRYSMKFATELIKLISEVIGNYETAQGEDKFTDQANALAREAIGFLTQYAAYMVEEEEQKRMRKEEKKKLLKKSKRDIKKSKASKKKVVEKSGRLSQLSLNQNEISQSFSKSPVPKSRDSRSLRRDRSLTHLNLRSNRHTKDIHSRKKEPRQNDKLIKLSKAVQALLVNILASSQTHPYLKNQTLHEVTNFIISHMNKGISEHKQREEKIKIELDIPELLPYLLRVRINQISHQGYFHKLAVIGFYLQESMEARVNLEIGIKRIFYQVGAKEIPMRQWVEKMQGILKMEEVRMSQLTYLLQIKKPKSVDLKKPRILLPPEPVQIPIQHSPQQKRPSARPSSASKKPQQPALQPINEEYEFVSYNDENYKRLKDSREVMVVLLPNCELNLINYYLLQFSGQQQQGHGHRGRDSSAVKGRPKGEEESYVPIKAVEYVPNRNLQIFIHEVISSFMRLIVKSMEEVDERTQMEEESKEKNQTCVEIFNLNILCQALIVLMKQSPCLVPFITKYKCRKLILQHIESLPKNPKTLLTSLLSLDNKKQLTFLAFLIRAGCPLSLNTNFNLIFTMCLDSTVIQKEKMAHEHRQEQGQMQHQSSAEEQPQGQGKNRVGFGVGKVGEQGELSFVSFGHVVRQKTFAQIQECLADGGCFIRRVSIINLLTKLLSIKQFSRLCIETPNFLKSLQKMYVDTLTAVKARNLPQMSIIAKKLLIPFYTSPITILLQININLQLHKKQKKKPPTILLRLLRKQQKQQLITKDYFHSTGFKQNWPFITIQQIAQNIRRSHHLEYFQNEEDSSDESEEDGGDSSQEEEMIQEYMEEIQAAGEDEGSQEERMMEEEEDESGSQGHEQYTNSWINYDTIMDDLNDINQEDNEEEIGEEGEEDDEDNDDDDDGDDNTIQINLYPDDEDPIEEEPDEEDQEDGDDGLDLQAEELGDPSSLDSPELSQQPDLNMGYSEMNLHLESASEQSNSQLEPYQNLRISGSPESLYKYFNEINRTVRQEFKNCIYDTQAEQDEFILLLLSAYIRKAQQPVLTKQDRLYKKINIDDLHRIEEHDLCVLGLLDNFDLLAYAEHIEYNNYSRYSAFQWKMPPETQSGYSDLESALGNPQFMEEILGRGRRERLGEGENNLVRGRNRRNGILLGNINLHINNAETSMREMEQNLQDPNSQLRRPPESHRPRVRVTNNDVRVEVGEVGEAEEAQVEQLEESSEHHLDQEPSDLEEIRLQYMQHQQNQALLGMDPTEINAALQTQGFSLQTFMQLPADLQADILQNIREQANLNQQFLNQPQPEPNRPQDTLNQNRPSPLSNWLRAQPSSPVLQPNTNPNANTNVIGGGLASQRSMELAEQGQGNQDMAQYYNRLSNRHVKKTNKDIIHLLNRDGRNNGKFVQSSDQFIEGVLELLYLLTDNDFIYFPYNLVAGMCINSHNESRILANLQAILLHGPNYTQKPNLLPHTIYTNNENQYIGNYQKYGYSNISLKILYILLNLTKSYSISMSMLYPQQAISLGMDGEGIADRLGANTMMQNLISLLKYQHIKDNSISLEYLLGIVRNAAVIKFNYHVHTVVNRDRKDKDKDKDKDKEEEKEKEKEKEKADKSRDASLELTEQNHSLLFSLLESDLLKQNSLIISKIIMRLSLNEKNLDSFVHYFKKIIRSLALKITRSLTEAFQKYGSSQSSPHRLSYKDKLNKSYSQPLIVRLMMIFYEIIKSMKKLIKTDDKNANLLEDFRRILECEEVRELCERGCQIVERDPSSPQLLPKIHQFIDCFFAVFNILGDKEGREPEKDKPTIKMQIGTQQNQPAQMTRRSSLKRKFNSNFIDLQTLFQKKLCTPQGKAFINANIRNKLNSALKGSRKFNESLFNAPIILVALETPHLLEFDNKKSLFKVEIKRLKQKKHYETVYLNIQRRDVFQQSFSEIMNRKAEDLKGKLRVEFEGEEGEDVGGLTREWFQLLSKQMFNPNYALFIPSSTGSTYQPYSKSYVNGDHLNYFKFIGRVMGKALHDGFLLDAFFTPAFYKHILGLPISFKDMQEQDFEYYKSLKWILENSPIQDYMQLNFTYQFDNFGQLKTQNLVPNGDQIQVSDQNKMQYVQLISTAKMAKSVEKQYENLLQGFHEFIPGKLVKIFDEKEIQIMISGLPTVDIEDLRRNTDLVNYDRNDKIIVWLFEVLERFDMSLRTAFLQFVTGTSRVPSQGFKSLQGYNGTQKFNIHKYYDIKHLPRSHTCFNQLDLPPYESKQILIEKLTLAITEGKEGFGML